MSWRRIVLAAVVAAVLAVLLHWLRAADNVSSPLYGALSGWVGDLSILTSAVGALWRMEAHHKDRMAQADRHHEALKRHIAEAIRPQLRGPGGG